MQRLLLITLALFIMSGTTYAAEHSAPRVVASIAPIHSLASGIMSTVGEPKLLMRGGSSPHNAALRPSDSAAIEHADLIIWVGPTMEQFVTKTLRSVEAETDILTLSQIPGLILHTVREGGLWDVDHHSDHSDHHSDNTIDPHIWLNPINAIKISEAITNRLMAIDPHRAEVYRRNNTIQTDRLRSLDRQLKRQLRPVQSTSYIVFHDAYQTFEVHFGLNPAGAVTIDPERRPGARRLHQIREHIVQSKAVCLFSEPQFEPHYVDLLTEGTALRVGILDPLGSELTPGPDLYFDLMYRLADSLVSCLTPAKTPSDPPLK